MTEWHHVTVGHVPRELSIVFYVFMKRGGKVFGRVYSTRYVRSPIPGGFEVPVEVTFTYEDDEKLSKIKSLIMDNYDGFDKIKEVECDDSNGECQVNQTT